MKITPYTQLYQRQIQYYNHTAYDTLMNDIGKILPTFLTDHRHKRGAILTSILGSVATSVIGLAYEGISSFLHHKRHKVLHKAVAVMDKKTNIQCNKIHHLEDTMIMYGVYNSDTLTDLIDTVHRMQNFTTWNEKTFAGKLHNWDGVVCSRQRHTQYYCEELFVVKSKTRYSCTSTIYFNLESDVIKANCEFLYYYNITDIKPTIVDGGFQIILANWPSYRKIMCLHNNNIPITHTRSSIHSNE